MSSCAVRRRRRRREGSAREPIRERARVPLGARRPPVPPEGSDAQAAETI